MLWILLVALGVWCLILQSRIGRLDREFHKLRRSAAIPPIAEALRQATEATVPESSPLPPAEEARAVAEPEFVASVETPESIAVLAAARADEPPLVAPVSEPISAQPEAAVARSPSGHSIATWLSENGLAWIGGGALALGGLMLVAYAAERGFFTPAMRVIAATVLGLAAMAAGEALRRGRVAATRNPLVAALTTAAGAAILYGAVWAAGGLYGFIPPWASALLLTAVCITLLVLALVHGEPMAILALAGAFAAPVVSGLGHWPNSAVDTYALFVMATGLGVVSLRRWTSAGAVTLAGVFVWSLDRAAAHDATGAAMLAIGSLVGILAANLFNPRAADAPEDHFPNLLAVTLFGAAFVALVLDCVHRTGPPMAALTAVTLPLVTAAGVRRRLIPEGLLAVPAAFSVLVAAVLAIPVLFGAGADLWVSLWLWPGLAALAVGAFACTLWCARPMTPAVIAAVGVSVALTLAAGPLAQAAPGRDWIIFLAFAGGLAMAAAQLGRRGEAFTLAAAAFIAVSAETAGLALHAILDPRLTPAGYAGLGLVLAAFSARLKWRGFAESAAVACLASFAALLTQPAPTGPVPVSAVILIAGAAAAAQAGVWLIARRNPAATSVEAISTLATMTALLGAFQVLQTLAQPMYGAGALLGAFGQASVRTVLAVAAGLMLSIRGAATPIGRYRAPAFLAIGALHGLLFQGLFLNPWWGALAKPVVGPPVLDVLAIGLLAPGLILAEAARRASRQDRGFAAAAFAGALAFIVLWIGTEIRRLFHGVDLTFGPTGFEEAAAYAAAAMIFAVGLEAGRARLHGVFGQRPWIAWALGAADWSALGLAAVLLAWVASPWWGPLGGALRWPLLHGALYAIACAGGVELVRVAQRSERLSMAHTATLVTGVILFVLITLVIRYAFRGLDMRAALAEASVETWTYSAVWALYGLAALSLGAWRRDTWVRGFGLAVLLLATAKVFLFDLAMLQGVARAASFLALGVILLAGALAARRLSGGWRS